MAPEQSFQLILLLMAAIVVLELLARRAHLPPAAAFIIGGIALALVPGAPTVTLDPNLVLVLFLPPLLMAGAYTTVWRDFRANLRVILQLAIGAVAFTTAVVGVVAHWLQPQLPWAACFALGAIVSPPDAVAAKAVLARVKLPRRMMVLLEGESLVNDAAGLVLYRFAVAAALSGSFSLREATASFGLLAAGGIAIGLAFGWLVMRILRRLQDAQLAIMVTMLVAWASYIVADRAGVSGVLATVTCGIMVGRQQHEVLTAKMRIEAGAVWQILVFVMESLVFILIGLSLRGVLGRLETDLHGLAPILPATAAIILTVILSRFAWIFPSAYLPRLLVPRLRGRARLPMAVPTVISWAGMRGVVSLAIALALPNNFPGRDFILATTFATILVTVLLQGSTLGLLIRLLRVQETGAGTATTLGINEARMRMAAAQLAAIQHASARPDGSQRHPRLVEQYGYRVQAIKRFSEAQDTLVAARTEHFATVLAAIAAGRAELLRLHRTDELHESVLSELEQELDLEEVTALRYQG